jgi:hypothetical protein
MYNFDQRHHGGSIAFREGGVRGERRTTRRELTMTGAFLLNAKPLSALLSACFDLALKIGRALRIVGVVERHQCAAPAPGTLVKTSTSHLVQRPLSQIGRGAVLDLFS